MVLLIIKELANSAEDIIMVTSTVMKDTGGSSDAIYRPNAIRALCRIIDVGGECCAFGALDRELLTVRRHRPQRSKPSSVL